MAVQRQADLDRAVGAARSSYWDQHVATAMGKRLVLVEGDDDRDILEIALTKRSRTWATQIHIVAAGSRSSVYKRLISAFPKAFGLVDRDTWTDIDILAKKQTHPRFFITEGWCLENIFLDPDWLALFNTEIAERLETKRENWVRAGALWWTVQRAREGQQRWHELLGWAYGLPQDDLDTSSSQSLRACLEDKISPEIRDQAKIDCVKIATQFEERCKELLAMSKNNQWRLGVHGKAAFKNLLVPELNAVAPQRSASAWRIELATQLPNELPSPIDALITALLA